MDTGWKMERSLCEIDREGLIVFSTIVFLFDVIIVEQAQYSCSNRKYWKRYRISPYSAASANTLFEFL